MEELIRFKAARLLHLKYKTILRFIFDIKKIGRIVTLSNQITIFALHFDKAKFTTSNRDNTTLYINEESFWYYTAHSTNAM